MKPETRELLTAYCLPKPETRHPASPRLRRGKPAIRNPKFQLPMPRILKLLWGHPLPLRVALSAALGVALGLCDAGTPVWCILLAAVFVFRTHVPTAIIAWACGCWLAVPLKGLCEPAGKFILLSAEPLWRALLSQPFVCYLNLNQGRVMGNAAVAGACSIVVFVAVLSVLTKLRCSPLRQPQKENAP